MEIIGLGAIVLSAFNNLATITATQTTQSSYSTENSLISQSSHDSTSPDILSFVSAIKHPTFTTSNSNNGSFAAIPTTSDGSTVSQTTSAPGDVSSSETQNGIIPISLGPSAAIYGTLTYSFESDKAPVTITTNGQTISIGPNGIGFAATTIAIPSPPPSINSTSQSLKSNTSTTPFSSPPLLNSTSSTLTTTSYLTITTPYPGDINPTTTLSSSPNTIVTSPGTPSPSVTSGGRGLRKRDLRLMLGSLVLGGLGSILVG